MNAIDYNKLVTREVIVDKVENTANEDPHERRVEFTLQQLHFIET